MLLKILNNVFIVIFYVATAMKMVTTADKINEILTKVIVFDKRVLQLQVNWDDELPEDTTYNVIVNPLNLTECPDMPCSLYGITKLNKSILMPENPISYLENMECNYMLGCNYTLTVETLNASVSQTVPVSIPYCVEHICSCSHAVTLPAVSASFKITRNRTMNIDWHLNSDNETYNLNEQPDPTNQLASIYIIIRKQTNPSLSWGGGHPIVPIVDHFYPLDNRYHLKDSNGSSLKGLITVELDETLPAKTILLLRTHVTDVLGCAGPETIFKTEVPSESEHDVYNSNVVGSATVTTLTVLVVGATLAFIIWRYQKAKTDADNKKNVQQYFPQFTTIIDEMEDNIDYVDKYVEEAQMNGLADMFEIPHHAIRLGPEIGEGAFGRVFKATAVNIYRMRGHTEVAVKQLKISPTADEIKEFLTEIEMLKGVGDHPNIVSFLGCCTIRPPYLMVMEFVGRGDLLSYLRVVRQEIFKCKKSSWRAPQAQPQPNCGPPALTYIEMQVSEESIYDDGEEQRHAKPSFAETSYTIIDGDDNVETYEPFQYILNHKELHNFALQIANGMRFLEEQKITHRDLAARNVLIDERKILKVSDFGLSRHGIYTNTKTRKLPLRWLAIESILDHLYSNKSDVWAYGVVLWEIGTLGASPYPNISNSELIPFLLTGQRLEKPEICTDEVYQVMQQCWHEDASERPSFADLYKILTPKNVYINISNLSDDYVFPKI